MKSPFPKMKGYKDYQSTCKDMPRHVTVKPHTRAVPKKKCGGMVKKKG